jgi:DNA-binding beta-propeller fold protein YncE
VADGKTHVVAVGTRKPNALTLLDAATGQIRKSVPLPGHLRHLQLAAPGGPVLVPDEDSNQLLTLALPEGTVTGRINAGTSPHDATIAANGTVFAANEAGRSVAAVRQNKVVHEFRDVAQPAGLAAVGDQVGLVDVAQDTLHVYDAHRLTALAQLPAGQGPTHVVADRHGRFQVIDTRGNAVLSYRLGPHPTQTSALKLPGTPYGVAYDPARDMLWVTLTARNEVAGIDLSGQRPKVVRRIPAVRQPNTVAVDSTTGRVWITGTQAGEVQYVDPPH